MRRQGLVPYFGNSLESYFDNFNRTFFGGMNMFKTDIIDKGDHYLLKADLPGVKREDIEIDVNNDILTVNVKNEESKEEKTENFIRRERVSGVYARGFDVSNIDVDQIKAAYDNGVLTLTMPKLDVKRETGRKIDIS